MAGNGRGQRYAEALERLLRERGIEVRCHVTAQAGDGERFARAIDADCAAVVGGDGTVNEVLNGLGEQKACLAILPAGSTNVVARELNFRRSPEKLAHSIARGRTRPMDLLECGDRRVVLGGGAGFDAAVAARVSDSRRGRLGLWRWVLPAVQTAGTYAYPMTRVMVDGRMMCEASPYVVVANCTYSAGIFRVTPKAKTDDGILDVVAVRQLNVLKIISLAVGTCLPSFAERKDLVYVQGRHVYLEPVDGVAAPLQLDGDPAGAVPAEFNVLPHAIRVLVST